MFKKMLVTLMLGASFAVFADVAVTWKDTVGYDEAKFKTWYAEPANAKLWSGWYTEYNTEPEFVTFCKQSWAGTYCKSN